MNRILNKRIWLAGASLLAIVLGSGDANAVVFQLPGSFDYIVPSTGWYDFRVAGAQGGGPGDNLAGASGAVVGGELFLGAGNALDIVAGGAGGQAGCYNGCGAGGGGGSFVFRGGAGSLLFAAGGGAGAPWESATGNPGVGYGGHPGGVASYGGGGGGGLPQGPIGVYHGVPATSGSFPNGGDGFVGLGGVGPSGGYGGGGGGGYGGGGGGGGAPGGAPGHGGYSYVIKTALDAFGITGGNSGVNGYVSIDFIGSSVPETSTWAMMLAGFSTLGGMLLRCGRKAIMPT